MRIRAVITLVALAACASSTPSDRAASYAAGKLGVDPAALRVTSESELTGDRHTFHLVTRAGAPAFVVVVPDSGEPFDSESPDAFSRVAQAEDASSRLSKLGAERVALWFGALGGHRCPMPASDDAHFARVERLNGNVRVSYPVGRIDEIQRSCVIELNPNGSLHDARLVNDPTPAAAASRWRSKT